MSPHWIQQYHPLRVRYCRHRKKKDSRQEVENPPFFNIEALQKRLSRPIPLAVTAILLLLALFNLSLWTRGWANFQFSYLIVAVTFILFGFAFYGSSFYQRFVRLPLIWQFLIIFVLAFSLRALFLPHSPALSEDIWRITRRADHLLAGDIPYKDFDVKKPPLYIYMIGGLGYVFGVGDVQYRIIFSLVDALNAGLLLIIPVAIRSRERTVSPYWKYGAFLYAVGPVAILESGLAGHYDPMCVLVVNIALISVFYCKGLLAGILLGAGFAMKVYPMFLFPGFFLFLKEWRSRVFFVIGFFIVPVVVFIPTLVQAPGSFMDYVGEQALTWYFNPSIQGSLTFLLEDTLPNQMGINPPGWINLNPLFLIFFFAVSGLFLVNVAGKKKAGVGWFRLMGSIMFIQLFFLVVFIGGVYYKTADSRIIPYAIFMIVADVALIIFLFLQYKHAINHAKDRAFAGPTSLATEDNRGLFAKMFDPIDANTLILSSLFILMLLVLTASQIHPWYFLWFFPFIVGVRDRYLLFWLFVYFTVFPVMFYWYQEFAHLWISSPFAG